MFVVALNNIRLFAPVGMYVQEAFIKNELEIAIAIADKNAAMDAFPFIDYAGIHAKVKTICAVPTPFLEDILKAIYHQLKEDLPSMLFNISVAKLNPPVSGKVGQARVSWQEF